MSLLFLINLLSLARVHLMLVAKPNVKSTALFLANTAPYTALLINPQPWLLIPAIPLIIFLASVLRGLGRSALANVSGTVLVASTYMPWYVMMGGLVGPRVLTAYIVWVLYHLFNAIYVEGRLPFRPRVKPWYSSAAWLTPLPAMIYISTIYWGAPFTLVLAEPTVRAIVALHEGKLGQDGLGIRIRRMGLMLTVESIAIMALLIAAMAC